MNIGSTPLPPVALIAGPTASGKSALALALAERSNGVVINADSAQVYRDLRILSARPTGEDERRAHHALYGYRDGAIACSAASWAEDAKAAIAAAHRAGQLPILAGGTGLYIRVLLDGIAPVPDIDPELRAEIRSLPVEQAFAALAREDPHQAHRLSPTDTTRIARSLEVIRSTGRSLLDWQQERVGGIASICSIRPLILLPPRAWLCERCDMRFEQMLEEGLGEARQLKSRGLDPALPVMRAIGVPQILAYLDGELSREQALEEGKLATRQYAKRQYTWFRHQPPAAWPRFVEALAAPEVTERALSALGDRVEMA